MKPEAKTPEAKKYSQFAHVYAAAPVAPKPRSPRKRKVNETAQSAGKTRSDKPQKIWSISDLLDEACRVPEACKHVVSPQEPQWLIGSREAVEGRATAWHAQAKKADGKSRYQQTSPAVAAIVISLNRDLMEHWEAYRGQVLSHFLSEYGGRVVGAVNHDDEAHPHLHVYVVPKDGEEFGVVHPGYGASRLARRLMPANAEKQGRVKWKAWNDAMMAWLDRLHAATSAPVGLERFGPRRRRLERNVHQIFSTATKKAEEAKAAAAAEADKILAAAKRTAARDSAAIAAAAGEAMDAIETAKAMQRKADEALAEASRQRLKNLHDAQAVSMMRTRLDSTPAAQLAAKIAALGAELEKSRAELARANAEIDAMKFRQRTAKEVEDRKLASVSVVFDSSGRQVDWHRPMRPNPHGKDGG